MGWWAPYNKQTKKNKIKLYKLKVFVYSMPNKNYLKGRRKEYKIMHQLKAEGYNIAHRTAGSHSPIDVFGFHKDKKEILLIQSKPNNFSELNQKRIMDELNWLSGAFNVKFEVR